jgi:hypothetical protein
VHNRVGNVEKALIHELQSTTHGPLSNRINTTNQLIKHNYKTFAPKQISCMLEGCSNHFEIMLIPNQIIYPKYCEEHRSVFRREWFLKTISAQK